MPNELLEAIRDIVRSELARAGVGLRAAPDVFHPHATAVPTFLATLPPGDVGASALYARWRAWAAEEAPASADITSTAFGRLAAVSDLVVRRTTGNGRRVYTVLAKVLPLPPSPGA